MQQKKLLVFDIVFFITILLIVLASAFSYTNINQLAVSADLVNHTSIVKLDLERTLSYVKDAESGVRGFIITRDSVFIPPIAEAMQKANKAVEQVKKITEDNPDQKKNVDTLEELVARKFAVLKNGLRPDYIPRPRTDPSYLNGRNTMEGLRNVMANMFAVEDKLGNEREKTKSKFVLLTPISSLLFSFIAIVIIAFVYYRLRKENQLRTKAESGEAIIHNFFLQVPAMLAILKGKEHRFVFANQPYIELIGNRDPVGKTILEAMPELTDQGFVALLDKVYNTQEPYIGKETLVTLNRNGQLEEVYVNFIYQSYTGTNGRTEGIMVFCYDVSEMHLNRKKIEKLEERSRLAIDASAMGVFDWDLQNQQFVSSPRLLEIFGFKDRPDTAHSELLSNFHPGDRAVRDKAVIDSYKDGSLIYEARVIWPDKTIHWVNVYGIVVYDENKEALRMYGSAIDITNRKNTLEELKENESKFRLLANSLPQQVWTSNAEGMLTYYNQTVYDYSGVNDSNDFDVVGWVNTIHHDEKQDNLKKWNSAVANGQEFVSEHRLLDQFGEYRWHITQAIPQFDKNGVVKMWVGTSTDVQEQKNFAEELEKKIRERTEKLVEKSMELKLSEDRYYSMINEVQDYAILLLDRDGNVQNWNKGAQKIKGYTADEIIGKNFRLFHLKEERDANLPERLMDTAITEGKAENLGWRIRKDGSRFWAYVVLTTLRDEKKNVIGFSKLTRDLTDMKNAEERQQEYLQSIEQKNIELERSNAELQSFNYIASHDLQEPLRKIQAFSSLLMDKEGAGLSASATEYFSKINKSAQGMQNLIEALISYSQANSSGVQLSETDMNSLLEEVKNDLSNSIEEKKAIIEYPVLPIVHADPIQFLQLFTNLVSNAIKYSKLDVPPHIKISAMLIRGNEIPDNDALPERAYWKISVEDNGIGFDQKYAGKIFELFQRLHGKNEYKGTGIGLAICKKIMRNHEGFISATSTLNSGCTFTVFLPLKNKFAILQH